MLKEAIGKGATVEEAQQVAIVELNAPASADVQFEVLELPVKKTLGLFGGSPAKVRAFYEAKDEPQAKVANEKAPAKAEPQKAPTPEKKSTPAKVIAYSDADETVKKAHDYLLTIIKGMGLENPTIEISEQDSENYLSISCEEDYSIIIGRRGETLDSIQYLVRLIANRGVGEDEYVRISLNIGNYRQKRENTLKEIARKSALRVIKYNRNVSLEPMNPFERRIIHTVVAEMKGVSSHSVGADADRRVIITPEGVSRPGSKGGYNNKNRGSNPNKGGRPNNRYNNNRPKYEPSAPQRPSKSDAAGASLYGKIEPKN